MSNDHELKLDLQTQVKVRSGAMLPRRSSSSNQNDMNGSNASIFKERADCNLYDISVRVCFLWSNERESEQGQEATDNKETVGNFLLNRTSSVIIMIDGHHVKGSPLQVL